MRRPDDRTLQRILVTRMLLVSVLACLALTGFIMARYLLDTPRLRRLTLERETQLIFAAIAQNADPTAAEYRDYPDHYAFRIYDHRTADHRKLVAAANPQLLTPISDDPAGGTTLSEGFGPVGDAENENADRWQMTDHQDIAGRSYWVQVAMVGDPAWRWQWVVGEEMRDHVMVPVLFIIPALCLAMLLSVMTALRPLRRTAAMAEALGLAVSSGESLRPLPEDRLPREVRVVVAAINAMLRRLEHALAVQKQFASDVAHELRTPLAVMLLQIARLPPGAVRDTIAEELAQLRALINQLLRFAEAEDAFARERQPVDLAAIARTICEELAGHAVRRGVMIGFDAPEHPVMLPGHAVLVDSAIRNLVENAIRFAPRGTSVDVQVTAAGSVLVEDRGPGVPDAQKSRIFERLWRADRSSGLGIGLALVRRVARLHGGEVDVEDRAGGGARFVLRLAPA